MSERDDKRGGSGVAIGCVVVIVLLLIPALYVLSIGPAAAIAVGHPFPASTLDRVYLPIGVLARNSEPVDKVITWYIDLWFD